MDNVIHLGGKKYQPQNIAEKKELLQTLRDLDAARFRRFIKSNLPELITAGWLEKTDDQLICLLHEMRSQYIGLGEDFFKSRNALRVKQFGYTEKEAAEKPLCQSCKWFRQVPEGESRSCMHLGSMPQDISCRAYIDND